MQVIPLRDATGGSRRTADALDNRRGIYILALFLPDLKQVTVGKLGRFAFPPGFYQYIGSAGKGVRSRVLRHLRKSDVRHWHLDYIMPFVSVIAVCALYKQHMSECELAEQMEISEKGERFPKGFGASDCGCTGHLIRHASYPNWTDQR